MGQCQSSNSLTKHSAHLLELLFGALHLCTVRTAFPRAIPPLALSMLASLTRFVILAIEERGDIHEPFRFVAFDSQTGQPLPGSWIQLNSQLLKGPWRPRGCIFGGSIDRSLSSSLLVTSAFRQIRRLQSIAHPPPHEEQKEEHVLVTTLDLHLDGHHFFASDQNLAVVGSHSDDDTSLACVVGTRDETACFLGPDDEGFLECYTDLTTFDEIHLFDKSEFVKLVAAEGSERPRGNGDSPLSVRNIITRHQLTLRSRTAFSNSPYQASALDAFHTMTSVISHPTDRSLLIVGGAGSIALIEPASRRIAHIARIFADVDNPRPASQQRVSFLTTSADGSRLLFVMKEGGYIGDVPLSQCLPDDGAMSEIRPPHVFRFRPTSSCREVRCVTELKKGTLLVATDVVLYLVEHESSAGVVNTVFLGRGRFSGLSRVPEKLWAVLSGQ